MADEDFAEGDSILDEDDEARNKELQDGKVIAEKIRARRETLRKIAFPKLLDIFNKNVAAAAENEALIANSRNAFKIAKEKADFSTRAPDYKHWAMQPMWSISQAVALLLDIEPSATFSRRGPYEQQNLDKYLRSNKELITAKRYFNYYDTLYNIVLNSNNRDAYRKPSFFIEWAKSSDIIVPEKLAEALRNFGHNDADWHAKFIEQATTVQRLEKELAEVKLANETLLKKPAKGIDPPA